MSQTRIIATTNSRFDGFAPYVASINERGDVAFWASLAGGGDGVFVWRGDVVEQVDLGLAIASHPDIDESGRVCAYARLEGGDTVLVQRHDGLVATLAAGQVGPLGPTTNERGEVAYRADGAIFVAGDDGLREVARAGEQLGGFQGLPCLAEDGAVVFRADRTGGGQGIYRWRDETVSALVETGDGLAELGNFPALGPDGGAVFAAISAGGDPGVWLAGDDGLERLDVGDDFESVRGALWCPRGLVVYATEPGAEMAIYAGGRRVLGIGDALGDDAIAAFVLNPVSINRAGQLALRLELTSGAEAIAQLDVKWA